MMRLLDRDRALRARQSMLGFAGVGAAALLALTFANAQDPAKTAEVATLEIVEADIPADAQDRAKEALRRGVRWLVKNQKPDGRWSISAGKKPYAGMESEVSLTARAVLALHESDALAGSKESREARQRGVSWLESQQEKDGCIGKRVGFAYMFGHALAVQAMCAEQTRAPRDTRLEVIRSAVNFSLKAQNPYRGWRYGVRDGDNDSKMTSMMLLGLHAAKKLGVEVPQQSFEMAESYLDSMVDENSGRVGWTKRGGSVGRLASTWETHPPKHSEEVTALVSVLWLDRGKNPARHMPLQKGASRVLRTLPEWSVRKGTVDYSYWYWGTRLFANLGGWQRKAWNESYLEQVLPQTQWLADGTATWPLSGGWCLPGLESYVTGAQVRTLAQLLRKS